MEKPKSSYAEVQLFARKMEDKKFQKVVYVKYIVEEFINLLDVMNSIYDNFIANKPHLYYPIENDCTQLLFLICLSIRVRKSCNIGDNGNLFLKLKSKLGLCHVLLTIPKTSPEKLTLTETELQRLLDIEKSDSEEEISCLKRAKTYV